MIRISTQYLAKILVVLLFAPAIVLSIANAGSKNETNIEADQIAIKGYDPVAYFTERRPVKGKPEYSYNWLDERYIFSSAKHRDMFSKNPEQYAPQFGGHCAMALTEGVTKTVDPEAWLIVDGKLYLTFSQKGREKLQLDLPGNLQKSKENWAKHQNQK